MSPSRILPLPTAGSKDFTAKKGVGTFHNLYHALHQASVNPQSTLHVLRPHIDAITKVFDKSSVKQAIRAGGLSHGQQQTVLKKILATDPKLHENATAKTALKKVVEHFNKEQSDLKKKMILRRRREQMAEGQVASPGSGSIAQIMSQKNEQRAGTVNQPVHVGSIGELRNRPAPPRGLPAFSPPRPSPGPTIPLKPMTFTPGMFKPPGK